MAWDTELTYSFYKKCSKLGIIIVIPIWVQKTVS